MSEERFDVLFGATETRPRPLRVVGGKGITLMDGDSVLLRCGSAELLRALLRLMSEGKAGSWAARTLSSLMRE